MDLFIQNSGIFQKTMPFRRTKVHAEYTEHLQKIAKT